jgi:hypothetical protein
LLQALNDPGDEIPLVPRVPAARFWVLAAVVAICAIASGLWFGGFIEPWPKVIDQGALRSSLQRIKDSDHARMGLHIVFGASILVLVMAMALLTRFAPRSRVILSGLSLLLVLAMAGQVWLGVLLLYDGDRGPLSRFKSDSQLTAPDQDHNSSSTQPTTSPSPATQPIAAAR